ncbi:Hypothetical protein PEIBARAKI_6147 [Petrimonas sp. IBARAKI]|nr:Hypothetical protein PEIBARAKI_6147 [Petrimonas sp. IBARAKI]
MDFRWKVYAAVNLETAEDELDNLELKWGEDYPIVIKSWRNTGINFRLISGFRMPSGASSTLPTQWKDIIDRYVK